MDAADKESSLQTLYLYQAALPGELPHLVAGLEFDPRAPRERKLAIVSVIGETMRPHVAEDDLFDVIELSGSYAEAVRESLSPLFIRQVN